MAVLLTLVRNEDLEKLLARVPQARYVTYLEGRGWERREANKVPEITIWEYEHLEVDHQPRYMGGKKFFTCHIMQVPAPFCFEKKYADVGRRAWELVESIACLEQRSPLAVLCEIEPRVCDWLDDPPCGWSAGS
jgi:hypothetical protein